MQDKDINQKTISLSHENDIEDTLIKVEMMVERAYNLGYDDCECGREVKLEEIKLVEDELKSFVQSRNAVIDEVLDLILWCEENGITYDETIDKIKALKTNESKEIEK